jgi:glycosyltransferase involved in cell wall biosynthesis
MCPPLGRFYNYSMAKLQLADVRLFIKILEEFKPDIVSWWNLTGLTKSLLPIPAAYDIPDIHFVDDSWMLREYGVVGEMDSLAWFRFWRGDWGPWFLRPIVRRVLASWERRVQGEGVPTRPFYNQPRQVCFVSEFRRLQYQQAGLTFPSSEVIYGGVSPSLFYIRRASAEFESGPLRLLYAGYLESGRGLHTIIEALGLLTPALRENMELSIAHTGPAVFGEYITGIKKRIEQLGLSNTITFCGKVPYGEMPKLYRDHHVLISATTLDEGLPLTMMEAMCAGCAVITTGSGGAIEIADKAEIPLFPINHPLALSRLIAGLAKNRPLVYQIGVKGQKAVLQEFTFNRMMSRICTTLQSLCASVKKNQSTGLGSTQMRPSLLESRT